MNTQTSVGELANEIARKISLTILEHFDLNETQKEKIFLDFQSLALLTLKELL